MDAKPLLNVSGGRAGKWAAAAVLATAIAIPAEGLRQTAYLDPPGILTVCYGSTRNVEAGRKYTLAECRARLDADMQTALLAVEHCAPGLPVETLAAFGDAVYNLGPAIACDKAKSTAARLLAAGEIKAACEQLPRWNKARVAGLVVTLPGLTKRRAAEQELCLQGVKGVAVGETRPSPASGTASPLSPNPSPSRGEGSLVPLRGGIVGVAA